MQTKVTDLCGQLSDFENYWVRKIFHSVSGK